MKGLVRTSAVLLIVTIFLSSCSMLTARGRQERAYARYVHKSSLGRIQQQKRFAAKGNTLPVTHSADTTASTEASGPESVSDGRSN